MKKIKNGLHWLVGHYRGFLFSSSKFGFLMRRHIREQIEMRLDSINRECYYSGACKHCGCSMPEMLMSDKQCEDSCYPHFYNRATWNVVKMAHTFRDTKTGNVYKLENCKFVLLCKIGKDDWI